MAPLSVDCRRSALAVGQAIPGLPSVLPSVPRRAPREWRFGTPSPAGALPRRAPSSPVAPASRVASPAVVGCPRLACLKTGGAELAPPARRAEDDDLELLVVVAAGKVGLPAAAVALAVGALALGADERRGRRDRLTHRHPRNGAPTRPVLPFVGHGARAQCGRSGPTAMTPALGSRFPIEAQTPRKPVAEGCGMKERRGAPGAPMRKPSQQGFLFGAGPPRPIRTGDLLADTTSCNKTQRVESACKSGVRVRESPVTSCNEWKQALRAPYAHLTFSLLSTGLAEPARQVR